MIRATIPEAHHYIWQFDVDLRLDSILTTEPSGEIIRAAARALNRFQPV